MRGREDHWAGAGFDFGDVFDLRVDAGWRRGYIHQRHRVTFADNRAEVEDSVCSVNRATGQGRGCPGSGAGLVCSVHACPSHQYSSRPPEGGWYQPGGTFHTGAGDVCSAVDCSPAMRAQKMKNAAVTTSASAPAINPCTSSSSATTPHIPASTCKRTRPSVMRGDGPPASAGRGDGFRPRLRRAPTTLVSETPVPGIRTVRVTRPSARLVTRSGPPPALYPNPVFDTVTRTGPYFLCTRTTHRSFEHRTRPACERLRWYCAAPRPIDEFAEPVHARPSACEYSARLREQLQPAMQTPRCAPRHTPAHQIGRGRGRHPSTHLPRGRGLSGAEPARAAAELTAPANRRRCRTPCAARP